VCNWQALFPYKIFGSSREIIKEVKCSVCNTTRSFINDCGHVKNKLYNGVLCFDEVIDFELITYDIVSNPVNKCSVFFSNDGDHYNYSTLISVVKYIQSPHQIFNITTWRFKAKEHDGVLSPENICPCGDSLKKYADCCLPRNGIYKKHIDIWFPFPLNVEPI
ncbi:TPA: SecC motif-containing protein, partial [Enterobacter hormaechei subsp. steigerwaltii]|nr:SecC motif-containing protein [Escherichia coli]HAT0663240.1 SecC motif-containing protein [Salmonella enterica subsp. enterica serovar Typhimurium]HAV1724096.1 SecC motif-containing protein [Enterobacter hormaechei subsp. steigerwaltii]HBM2652315.1 SecC motif-containing protein [Enterobacter hormaechei subsp. hoffmannii]